MSDNLDHVNRRYATPRQRPENALCSRHTRYRGLVPPAGDCETCWDAWEETNRLKDDEHDRRRELRCG